MSKHKDNNYTGDSQKQHKQNRTKSVDYSMFLVIFFSIEQEIDSDSTGVSVTPLQTVRQSFRSKILIAGSFKTLGVSFILKLLKSLV